MKQTGSHSSSLIIACGLALLAVPVALAGDIGAKFKSLDADNDGKVSRAEHAAAAKKTFESMDANHDGVVTAAEISAAGDVKAGASATGMSFASPSSASGSSAAERIKAFDIDGDGKLTAGEHASGSDSEFSRLDTNSDGYLSQDELAAGHEKEKKDK